MNASLLPGPENIIPHSGEALLYPGFLPPGTAHNCYQQLIHEVSWKQEPIILFGKKIMQPRLTAWYGSQDAQYSYSGITMQPLPWTPTLLQIKTAAENMAGAPFNSALLNLYRDGKDSMGWHRDNEKELGDNPVIASVSLGASRRFLLRLYTDKKQVHECALTNGSLLLMRGPIQHHWEHSVPKTARPAGPRINITFRLIR